MGVSRPKKSPSRGCRFHSFAAFLNGSTFAVRARTGPSALRGFLVDGRFGFFRFTGGLRPRSFCRTGDDLRAKERLSRADYVRKLVADAKKATKRINQCRFSRFAALSGFTQTRLSCDTMPTGVGVAL